LYISAIGLIRGFGVVALKESLQYYLMGPLIYFGVVSNPGSGAWIFNRRLMKAVVAVHLVLLAYYYVFLAGRVYPGIGTPSIAVAAIYFLKSGAFPLAFLGMVLVFLEGKRGVMVAVFFALLWSPRIFNRGPCRNPI